MIILETQNKHQVNADGLCLPYNRAVTKNDINLKIDTYNLTDCSYRLGPYQVTAL